MMPPAAMVAVTLLALEEEITHAKATDAWPFVW